LAPKFHPNLITIFPGKTALQKDGVSKPADAVTAVILAKTGKIVVRFQPASVLSRQLFSLVQNLLNPGELLQAERAIDVGEPVTKAGFTMLKPVSPTMATLIPQASNAPREPIGICNHGPAFSRGDHFIWIESNYANVSKRSCLATLAFRSQGLTSIFDYYQGMAPRNFHNLFSRGRKTEGMDEHNRFGLLVDCLLDC
jgi:hypothetical protein